MPAKTFTGARGKLCIISPDTGLNQVVGIFNNVSYNCVLDVTPIFILGRFSAAETVFTGAEPCTVTATGWRVIGQGPHVAAGVPTLQQLLTSEYMTMILYDRQPDASGNTPVVATIRNLRSTGFSTSVANRNASEITCSFIGLIVDDESVSQAESPGATSLP